MTTALEDPLADLREAVEWLETDYFAELRARFSNPPVDYSPTIGPESMVDEARWPTPAASFRYLRPKTGDSELMVRLLTEEVPGVSQQ